MTDEEQMSKVIRELREEVRYWHRQTKKARRERDEARERSSDIARPRVEVVQGEVYWRVLVNGEKIDGYEEKSVAETIARSLQRAFEPKGRP